MTFRKTINAIDVHAAGEPGRVLIDSHLLVKGATMAERLQYCREHLDDLRLLLLHEPRGYPGLCAVFVLPPVEPDNASASSCSSKADSGRCREAT